MVWPTIVWWLITLVVSIALAPKPPRPKPAALEDFDLPTAEIDRPLPVLFGTKRITGPNVCWYGDYKTTKLKHRSLFSSTTIGYKYHLGIHFGMCYGPIDEFSKIEVGDKEAWSGSVTANTQFDIEEIDLFGGDRREGGMFGRLSVQMGADTQQANAYMAGQVGGPLPAYRGMFGLVWERGTKTVGFITTELGYVGNSPFLKPWAITAKRITQGWFEDNVWYPDKAEVPGQGMNPAHIIYQVLTDPRFGEGALLQQIDEDSFRASADALHAEGLGLNLLWTRQLELDQFLEIVINHINAVLAHDPVNDKYVLKLLRGDYDPDMLDVFDQSTGVLQEDDTQSWGETVNEITVTYTDPDTLKSTTITVHDLANIRAQGAIVSEQVDYSGLKDFDLAKTAAGFELRERATPLRRGRYVADRNAWTKTVGDVFKLDWPPRDIQGLVCRVLRIRQGTLEHGKITIDFVQDIFSLGGMDYAIAQASGDEAADIPASADPDTNPNVLSRQQNSPPVSPSDGDRYLLPQDPPATGAWVEHEGQIAEWDDDEQTWAFIDLPEGIILYDEDTGQSVRTDSDGNVDPFEPGGDGGVASTGLPAGGARIERSVAQTIDGSIAEPIVWDSQLYDTEDYWPNGSEFSQLVVPFSGQYHIAVNVGWNASEDGDRVLSLVRNSNETFASTRQASVAGLEQHVSTLIKLSAGDVIEAYVHSTAMASVEILRSDGLPHLAISRIRTLIPPTQMRGATWVRAGGAVQAPTNDVALYFPKPAQIHGVVLLGGPSNGSCIVDIWKAPIGEYPPTVGDSIVGSSLPEITGARTFADAELVGWDTLIAADEVLFVHLEASATFERVFVQLEIRESE